MKVALDSKSLTTQWPALVGVVLCLAALWQGWQGWQLSAAKSLEDSTGGTRTAVAAQVNQVAAAQIAELEKRRTDSVLIKAVAAGQTDSAKSILGKDWPGVQGVEFHQPDLADGYANPDTFGYGKLAALEQALNDNAVRLSVAVEDGQPKMVLAAPVMDDGRLLSLAYVSLPVDALLAPVAGTDPGEAFLALRHGRHTLVAVGDQALASSAEAGAIEISGTPMRVVASAPLALAGLFGYYGEGEYGVAGALLLVGIGLVVWSGRRARAPAADAAELTGSVGPTLADLQKAGHLVAPEAAPIKRVEVAVAAKVALDRSIFRAYDIRGVIGSTLDASVAKLIGQAVGSVMQEKGASSIAVGRDGRLSSPELAAALIEGLRLAGRNVIDIGEAATPMAYFAAYHLRTGSCISVTGSHNPPDYNGFKIVVDGETLAGDAISNLYARIADNQLHVGQTPGTLERRDISEDYIQRIAGDMQIERRLRVVVDCGSGVPGATVPRLMAALGVDVEPLFCEVDGTFPHHHPDPSDPANLVDLVNMVKRMDADIGLAFDGDGDRLGVVTKSGEMIYPDRLLMLFAADVLERNPGATIIYDVKCTGHLATHILRHGGSPLMWKTGHSLIKAKMRETEAELAGEMSGHFFFRERWYGFDDGMYAAARLLEILSTRAESPEDVFASLPKGVSTPELKIVVEEGEQYRFIERYVANTRFEGARIATIDGLRADWPDGWGLVRASNTTPVIVLRFDAKDEAALRRIQDVFRASLLAVKPDLQLPF